MGNEYYWIHDLLSQLADISSEKERSQLLDKFRSEHPDEFGSLIINDTELLIRSKLLISAMEHKLSSLSPSERAELEETEHIINENLFDYYFQPIVNTTDGEIYSYEALMRPKSSLKLTPLQILKYAEIMNRLPDIERGTFMNVLGLLDLHKNKFTGKFVFINSIPEVKLNADDFKNVTRMLLKHADTAVVEMTEQSEVDDRSLEALKERYKNMGIRMAIDDYGSGYSNVGNLLRYMPNFVKIDRSLLSDIHEYPQKQHFVREIIDFCHDNGIKALAEGVETAEELRTVIHLGADLIQGFYTARPSADIITQIDEKCRSEIRQYHQERTDGNTKHIYNAGKTNRVSLAKLVKGGVTDIVIGCDEMVYKDISIIGTPQMKTDIHVRIEPEYRGRVTLEDVYFSNVRGRPAIELGENTIVTLALLGTNKLFESGILVPESSKLVIEGDGALSIELNAAESYGIGAPHSEHHGEIVFEQDGPISISCRGKSSIGIGSGLGGAIHITRGEFILNVDTESCVGIGSIQGATDLAITTCHIEAEFSTSTGVFIGSVENDARISVEKSSVNFSTHGKYLTAIGTLNGSSASISTEQVSIVMNVLADKSTCFGALNGHTDIDFTDSHIKIEAIGQEALALGGRSGDTRITIADTDTNISVRSALGKDTLAPDENICIRNGRHRFTVNGVNIERDVIIEYS